MCRVKLTSGTGRNQMPAGYFFKSAVAKLSALAGFPSCFRGGQAQMVLGLHHPIFISPEERDFFFFFLLTAYLKDVCVYIAPA